MPPVTLLPTLFVFAVQWLIFSGAGIAAQIWRRRLTGRGSTGLEALLLNIIAPCVLGYFAFAAYFTLPLLGRVFSWTALVVIFGTLAHAYLLPLFTPSSRARCFAALPALHGRLFLLTLLAGSFYISTLLVYQKETFTETARQRFVDNMPGDNEIPRIFAERLYIGMSPKRIGGDWLSSDRPPLQSGLALVTMPVLHALGYWVDTECPTAGVWFQLLWIPALWVFLRWLGLTERQAHGAVAALIFTGFLLFNSIFVWPKLAGAALVLLAFCTFFATEQAIDSRHRWIAGGALAALGSLAHGGVMFSLLALAPLALFGLRRRWRQWLLAGVTFTVISLPWFAYQRFYEPPGNRLVKWHIGGSIVPDSRGLVETLVTNYRAQSWEKTLHVRRTNVDTIFAGGWQRLLATRDPAAMMDRRREETFFTFRNAATWILGLVALPVLAWQFFRRRPAWRDHVRRHGLATGWLALTLALWVALMFIPSTTQSHQGSYVVQLLTLGLLAGWTLLAGRALFVGLALVQLGYFVLTWTPPSIVFATAIPDPLAIGFAGVTAVLIIALGADALFSASPRPAVSPSLRPSSAVPTVGFRLPCFFDPLRAWFREPRLTPWALAGFAILLFLRKPYGLVVPQLYAEDGSIFLTQNDLVGLRALLEPYMGYLHTIPRLLAWLASRLLDPAWWPTFYNLSAYVLWLAVIARTFSPRLNLPHKVWLAAAFFLGPHTGEILCSITNLQWVLAFLLIEQAFIAPPANHLQRFGDLALLVLLGLTGPFIIALGPLLAWRWWRSRSADNLALLLVATACAGVQAWFIVRTGPKFEFPPFVASRFFEVVGQHLLVWPVLGDHLATHLPSALVGFLGITPVVALLAWSLRPHPRRLLRAQLVAAFLLMMIAGVYRSRPDTWNPGNLVFSDRYFYLPRVLLAWLFILEIDAAQRAIAWCARAILLACALVHVKGYMVHAEPDYRWTENVDPIRRGVPAKIPTLPEGWTLEYLGRPK